MGETIGKSFQKKTNHRRLNAQILLTPVSVDELGNNLRKRLESSDADAKKQKFPG
jgi:hypothetical protein